MRPTRSWCLTDLVDKLPASARERKTELLAQALLRARGIRTTCLAKAAGLSYYTVVHILNGHHSAGWYAAARIQNGLRELGLDESEARCA